VDRFAGLEGVTPVDGGGTGVADAQPADKPGQPGKSGAKPGKGTKRKTTGGGS
jgi:hypothetical protein